MEGLRDALAVFAELTAILAEVETPAQAIQTMKRKTKRLITVERWTETVTVPIDRDDVKFYCLQCGAVLDVGGEEQLRASRALCTPDDCTGSEERQNNDD